LIETLVHTVADIDGGDDDVLDSLVKVVTLLEHELEIGATSNDNTAAIGLFIGDEVLLSELTALDDVGVTLFFTKTRETHRRLTTATVLLRQLHGHTLNNLLVATLEGGEEHTVTVDDDETESVVIFQQGQHRIRVERVLALVRKHVDRLEWFKVDFHFFLRFAVLLEDDTTEETEAVRRGVLVQLKHFTRRRDSRQHGLARLTRLN